MKKTILQRFQTKAEAFEWVMFMMLDFTVGDIDTSFNYNEETCVRAEGDDTIFIGVYEL